jgi:signal transduction histidine kinase
MAILKSLTAISHYGTSLNYPPWKNRGVVIANNVAMLCTLVVLILTIGHGLSHSDNVVYVGLTVSLLFLLIPFVNRLGKADAGRTSLTLLLILGTMILTIARKVSQTEVSLVTYFLPRTGILFFAILPFAIFNTSERKLLVANILSAVLALLLFDPIHNSLGIGFYQKGFTDPDYYYVNFLSPIVLLILVGGVAFFKIELDGYERRNDELIAQLRRQNNVVTDQKEELQSQGEVLRQLVQEKDKDLSLVTQQVINFNHELLQYSYTISHNLRGPVAQILGLLNLLKLNGADRDQVEEMLNRSAHSLDEIISDLNNIVEVRSDSFNIRERVDFKEEIKKIELLLARPIQSYKIELSTDIRVNSIFCAKQRINFILFSLISNAIQFRREGHQAQVKVTVKSDHELIVVDVEDNGKGIDLPSVQNDLFRPFRRFHLDASGKGINLYLVKLQVERLHGKIEVQSTPGKGTKFSVSIKDWSPDRS